MRYEMYRIDATAYDQPLYRFAASTSNQRTLIYCSDFPTRLDVLRLHQNRAPQQSAQLDSKRASPIQESIRQLLKIAYATTLTYSNSNCYIKKIQVPRPYLRLPLNNRPLPPGNRLYTISPKPWIAPRATISPKTGSPLRRSTGLLESNRTI